MEAPRKDLLASAEVPPLPRFRRAVSGSIDRTPHHAAVGRHPLSARGSMVALSVQTLAPNVYLLALLALLDRLVLSPVIARRLGSKAARRADG